jgi:hypothetical protein
MHECRTLHWWTKEQLAFCETTFTKRVRDFFSNWGDDQTDRISFQFDLLLESSALEFSSYVQPSFDSGETIGVWLAEQRGLKRYIRLAILGMQGFSATEDPLPTIADELSRSIHENFLRLFWAVGEGSHPYAGHQAFPPHALMPWSGFVRIHSDVLNLTCVVSPEFIQGLLGCPPEFVKKTADITQLAQALSPKMLTLSVQLKPLEMQIGSIQQLREGDVILLQHLVDEVVEVRTEDDASFFSAYLGCKNNKIVVELVPNSSKEVSNGKK